VVGGAPAGVKRHFHAVGCFRRSRGTGFAVVVTIIQSKQKLFNQLPSCIYLTDCLVDKCTCLHLRTMNSLYRYFSNTKRLPFSHESCCNFFDTTDIKSLR